MMMTQHAVQRCHERHISPKQLEWLLSYGQESHNRGVSLFYFDRDSFTQLIKEVGPERLELALRSRNVYAVLSESTVITVGYRAERLKPQKSHKRIRRGMPAQPAARRIHHRTC